MKLKLKGKLMILFAGLTLFALISIQIYSLFPMKKNIIGISREKLIGDLALGLRLIETKYPGDWSLKSGELYKGTTLMNDNFSIVDEVGNATGDKVTIFAGDTRVATNVRKDGQRAVNTKVSDEVAKAVLKGGQVYLGEADVVGIKHQTAYQPLKNAQGEIVGIWFVGIPFANYNSIITDFIKSFISGGFVAIIFIMGVAWYIANILVRPILELLNKMQLAREGDLTVQAELRTKDEIGALGFEFNSMIGSLKNLTQQVAGAAQQVAESSQELNASSEETNAATQQVATTIAQLSSGASQQAEEVVKAHDVVTQMSAGIEQVAANSHVVSRTALKVSEAANKGSMEAENAVNKIEQIREISTETSDAIKKLGEESQQIGQIVDVIKGIADQTNLLALNAAIEAARAGEQGRGFAVVAEEVRKLAEESSTSAQQIAQLISKIQRETLRAVEVMEVGNREVVQGVIAVSRAGASFKDILEETNAVVSQIQEVSAALDQMAAGSTAVVKSIESISLIAQQTAASGQEITASTEEQTASMEEVARASQKLANIAEDLQITVAKFNL